MKKIFLVFLFLIISTSVFSQKKVIGYYYANYANYPHTAIDYNSLTHIAHAFIRANADGSIAWDSWFLYPELIETAHQNGVKIIVAVGGWGNSEGFFPMAADPDARAAFVENIKNFCLNKGYDGIDIDWEYPKAEDRDNLVALVTALRTAFDDAGLEIISAALPSTDWSGGYDIANLKDKLDWFGIMTYDYYGPWEANSGLNSPLFPNSRQNGAISAAMNYYISKGVPKDKLMMGLAFYGYSFKASDLYVPHSGATSISYVNANAKLSQGWNYNWHEVSKVPYLQDQNKTEIITYDDTSSIKFKCNYALQNDLGGTIIWKIGFDYSNGSAPLLTTVGKYMLGNDTIISPPPPPVPDSTSLFDDFEDNDSTNLWGGNWEEFIDANASSNMNMQIAEEGFKSNYSLNVEGQFSSFGGIAGYFRNDQSAINIESKIDGFSFAAKSNKENFNPVRVRIREVKAETARGYAYFSYTFTPESDWNIYEVPFSDLVPQYGEPNPPFDATDLYAIDFGPAAANQTVDVLIDSVVFWRAEEDTILSVGDAEVLPERYDLRNYPNPFNPSTKIEFSIPESGKVKLSVYDTLGKEIDVLINEEKPAGKYIVDFNAGSTSDGLSSGIYFYRLQSGGKVLTRKMILIK